MSPKPTINALVACAVLIPCALGCGGARSPADARNESRERATEELGDATQVLTAMRQIPESERQRARCVAVVPSLIRAGLVVGGRYGSGVATCRTASGWSAPFYLKISGGSAGAQIGVESSDIVMLVMSDRGLHQLLRSSFALGADVSAAAGPEGGSAQAGTDASLTAEILSYSRSRGLFAGAELSGAVVKQDQDATTAMYGDASLSDVLTGAVPPPPQAKAFLESVSAAFPTGSAEKQGR